MQYARCSLNVALAGRKNIVNFFVRKERKKMNKVHLIGRLGRDAELRYARNGSAVCNLSLATSESYKDKNGEKVEKTEWHRISVFGRTAETLSPMLIKGCLISVEGSAKTRTWTDQQNNERKSTEINAQRIQLLERKRPAEAAPDAGEYPPPYDM